MAKTSYYDQFTEEKFIKFNELSDKLPYFCGEYFTGVDMRTSILTKLNYATDFLIFFDFLVHKVRGFIGKEITEITLDDLDKYVTASEIEYFLRYLSFYSFNGKPYRNGEKAKARKLSSIRSMFKYFYNKDKLKENVASKVATPKLHEKAIIRRDGRDMNGGATYALVDPRHDNAVNYLLSDGHVVRKSVAQIREDDGFALPYSVRGKFYTAF